MYISGLLRTVFIVFCFSESVHSTKQFFDYYKAESFDPFTSFINYTGISNQCTKDVKTWINSIELITKTSSDCLLFKNCSAPVLKILEENIYAIQQYDAFGKIPSPGLLEISLVFDGSYQECKRISGVKYKTNYCYALLVPGRKASCAGGNINNIGTTIAFRRAVCMPDSCGSSDTVNLYNQLTGLPLTACATFCAHRDVPKDVALWGFTTFLVVILTFAVLATTVDFLRESLYSITSKTVETTFSFFRVLYAFSFWTNAGSILNVSPQPSTHIKCLDCLRGISMAWVLSAHMLNYFAFSDTLMPIKSFADYFADSFFINANFSVDTFFLISGITVAYSFFKLKPTPKTLKSPSTWILFYVHRYIRLTPPYMIFIGFYAVYSLYIQGPLAASLFNFTVLQVEACKASWWRNLIYINNFDNGENPCYGPSWYLAVDTQLYLIAPFLLVALAWKPISGVLLSLVGCVGSMITVFVLYFKFDNMTADSFHSDPSGKFNFYLYQKPWIRCPPYLVGILVGYLLAKRPPPTRLAMWKKVILIIISIGLPFTCLTANRGYDEGKQQLQRWFVKATYYNFSRFLWSTSVAYIVMACHYGWAGPIGNFMNHPIWQPLGRLSYSAYIVHLMVVYYFLNVGDKPLHFVSTWQVYVYYILPATILTFTFAFFWSCLFELPIVKLEKFLLEVLLKKKVKPETSQRNDIVEVWK
ncbi:hypothetical protein CRE_05433 [Caenorhabditis remanei]|uniref:Nose resistant-to-fluoxetine protein N-terminal domain-containing protein n=1 Tax=Caenorhabditis remanei TaxID=31234 RepID=E3M0I3_CAERE|nr:hypothetical protein CRE_05433 [Caenorhabditis remanei]